MIWTYFVDTDPDLTMERRSEVRPRKNRIKSSQRSSPSIHAHNFVSAGGSLCIEGNQTTHLKAESSSMHVGKLLSSLNWSTYSLPVLQYAQELRYNLFQENNGQSISIVISICNYNHWNELHVVYSVKQNTYENKSLTKVQKSFDKFEVREMILLYSKSKFWYFLYEFQWRKPWGING